MPVFSSSIADVVGLNMPCCGTVYWRYSGKFESNTQEMGSRGRYTFGTPRCSPTG